MSNSEDRPLPESITLLTQYMLAIPVDRIRESPVTLRTEYDEESLIELGHSLKNEEQLQAILVQPSDEDGFYDLIIGSRRTRAARLAQLPTVFARVTTRRAPVELLLLALSENLHREDLNPFEEAQAFMHLQRDFGLPLHEVARRINKGEQYIRTRLELLSMPEEVKTMVASSELGLHFIKSLARLPNGPDQVRLARDVVQNRLTGSELTSLVRRERDEPVRSHDSHELTPRKARVRLDEFTQWLKKVPRKLKLDQMNRDEQDQLIKSLQDLESEARLVRSVIAGMQTPVHHTHASGFSKSSNVLDPRNHDEVWPVGDTKKIMAANRPSDEVLARQLGRTVAAIKSHRSLQRSGQKA